MKKKRLKEVDVATGIAMILVISGHLSEDWPYWYKTYKTLLYKFHMPYFMFISGFLLSYSNHNYKGIQSYLLFLKSKGIKFLIPYVFMSVIFFLVKCLLGNYTVSLDLNSVIKDILLSPISGPSGFLWYIYVLFQYYLFFPLINQIKYIRKNFLIIILVGILFTLFNPFNDFLQLNLFAKYFIFFAIGFFVANSYKIVFTTLRKYGFIFVFIFLLFIIYCLIVDLTFSYIYLALFSIPSLLYFSLIIGKSKILELIGQNTFTIYIWNSAFIFATIFVITYFDNNILDNFLYYVPFLIVIGLCGPLFLKKITSSYKILRYIIP